MSSTGVGRQFIASRLMALRNFSEEPKNIQKVADVKVNKEPLQTEDLIIPGATYRHALDIEFIG